MIKKLLFALFLVSFSVNAQDSIRVKLEPNNGYKWLMLYKINGAQQQYISNASLENDEFILPVSEDKAPGMYRMFYDMDNGGYFDFLYNKEPISVTFNPALPEQTAIFHESEENKIFQSYLNSIVEKQVKLDSVQMAYFDADDKASLKKMYVERLKSLNAIQEYFEKESEGKMANVFIKATKKYNSAEIKETPGDFLKELEDHFFDHIDFGSKTLLNSSVIVDKVIEYVFYINGSEDKDTLFELRKKMISNAMGKMGNHNDVKVDVLSSLIYAMAGQEDLKMVEFLRNDYYSKLPEDLQDAKFIADIDKIIGVAIGQDAPEITWKKDGKSKKLSDLNEANSYIVVFWSTTCSHCLEEIPQLYKATKDIEGLQVIGVVLEDDKFGFDYHTEMMDKWINVLALKKWENEIARSYQVNSTPSYFVLDKDKKIVAKPEHLADVLEILPKTEE